MKKSIILVTSILLTSLQLFSSSILDSTTVTIDTVEHSLCAGEIFELEINGEVRTLGTGNYEFSFQDSLGCSRVLYVFVHPLPQTPNKERTICIDENDPNAPTPGTYMVDEVNIYGCPYMDIIHYVTDHVITHDIELTICDEVNYNGYDSTGVYVNTYQSFYGCDSVVTLDLTVVDELEDRVTYMSGCSADLPLVWGDSLLYETGIYEQEMTDEFGCSFTETLNITIHENQGPTFVFWDYLCADMPSVEVLDTTITSAGEYRLLRPDENGCQYEAIVIIEEIVEDVFVFQELELCYETLPVLFEGSLLYSDTLIIYDDGLCFGENLATSIALFQEGSEQIIVQECTDDPSLVGDYITSRAMCLGDSIIQIRFAEDSIQDVTICEGEEYLGYNEDGMYTVDATTDDGCNYNIFLTLEVVPIADCMSSTELLDQESLAIYPNPATDQIIIEGNDLSGTSSLRILDASGQIILNDILYQKDMTVDLSDWPEGVYFLQLSHETNVKFGRFLKI